MVEVLAVLTIGALVALGLRRRFGIGLIAITLVAASGAVLLSVISLSTPGASATPLDVLAYSVTSFALLVAVSMLSLGPLAVVPRHHRGFRFVLALVSLCAWLVAVATFFVYPTWRLAGICLPPGVTYSVLRKDGGFDTMCEIPAVWGPVWLLVIVALYVAVAVARLPTRRGGAFSLESDSASP